MADEEEYVTVSGERITLQRRHYSASCREFLVRCPRLQLRSLSAVTCSVWLVAYGLFVLCQVPKRPPRPAPFHGLPPRLLRVLLPSKGVPQGFCEPWRKGPLRGPATARDAPNTAATISPQPSTCPRFLQAFHACFYSANSVVLSAAIFVTLIGLLVYLHFVKIDQESLLIVGSLGIQMTSSYASGKESTTFIEMNQVKDVVINEAIYMDPIEPHIVSEVVPLFQSSKPRLDCLVEVYKSCQEILEQNKKS